MNFYALLLRNETIDFGSYGPEDMQKIMSDFDVWNAKMISAGQLIVSASLQDGSGKTLRTGIISDGPYSEAKEAVAGLLLIQAVDDDQAAAIAAGCPFLPRGGSVEVRLAPQLEFEDAARPIMDVHAQARTERKSN
jgi:hypothetical protein